MEPRSLEPSVILPLTPKAQVSSIILLNKQIHTQRTTEPHNILNIIKTQHHTHLKLNYLI